MEAIGIRKGKKAFIIICTIFLLLLFSGSLIAKEMYERSPKFVLGELTSPYESEAKDFFYTNQCNLVHLSEIYNTVNVDSYIYYTFNQDRLNTSEIPVEVCRILCEIEKQTNKNYSVLITQCDIRITLGFGTYFDVYLHYGTPPLFDSMTGRKIELESGWTIYSEYVLRG